MADLPFFQDHPYRDLFIMVLLEEAGVYFPIPGDAILLFFGVSSRDGTVGFLETLIVVCIASAIGASILYFLSGWLGKWVLENYAHFLKYIHITQAGIDRMEKWMQHYGGLALVFARVIPGLRIIGTVAAGVLGVPYHVFLASTLTGTVIWVTVLFWTGSFVGKKYGSQINTALDNHWLLGLAAIIGVVAWVLMLRFVVPKIEKERKQGRLQFKK